MRQRKFAARTPVYAGLVLGLLSLSTTFATVSFAGPPGPLAGEILGQVKNATGVAQMGASVILYNRFDELVSHGFSNEQGRFVFQGLVPDVYKIRVLLDSFVPAERRNIAVLPSTENRLEINLTSVLSTVQLTSGPSSQGYLLSDDWKWVLRSSQATRPILRLLPEPSAPVSRTGSSTTMARALSNTTGVVKLSGGDTQSLAAGSGQELGTGFSIATSLADASRLQLSGTVGYSTDASLPTAGVRTSYTRSTAHGASHPEFILTARQVYLAPAAGSGESAPALRTMSAAFVDRFDFSNVLSVDYGLELQAVSFLHRVSSASPFVRVSYEAGSWGKIRAAASSGARPAELAVRDRVLSGGLDQDLVALSVLPSVARANRRLTMERSQNVEIGWERVAGSRTYSAGAYEEVVSNAAFMLSGSPGMIPWSDLLPDLSSRSTIFDVGSYQRLGYIAAVKQALGEHAEVSLSGGRSGALLPEQTADSQDLRAGIRQGQRGWVAVRVAGTVPGTKTRLAANYGWTNPHALIPAHLFVTQSATQDIGLNIFIRQPLPFGGMPWHLEAIAEMRNLLAQGYLPLGGPDTHAILTNAPRAMRGGLNIIF